MIRRLAAFLTAFGMGLLFTAVPAHASTPTNVDMAQRRIDTGSMTAYVYWHIGSSSMKACELDVISQRSETHSVRLEVYRPSSGTVYFATVINSVVPGEMVGTLGHVMDLKSIGTGLAARFKWGDSSVWHVIKSDRSQAEVDNFYYTFGTFPCP